MIQAELDDNRFLAFDLLTIFFLLRHFQKPLFFSSLVSGTYFFRSFKRLAAWFLSMAVLNWFKAGGTLRRINIIFFIRCKRTYFGHFTKRVRSVFGRMSPPMRKFFGVFSNNELFCTFFLLFAKGAAATFLPALPMIQISQ